MQWVTHSVVIVIADILVVVFSFFAALWLRFDMRFQSIPKDYFRTYLRILPIWCAITIAVFLVFKLYHSIWTYVSIDETFTMVKAYAVIVLCYVATKYILKIDEPRSFYFFGVFIAFVLHVVVRFSYRLVRYLRNQYSKSFEYKTGKLENVMIIGGGSAGSILIRELKSDTHQNQRPVCIIDDNPAKIGRELYGIPIVGGRNAIVEKAAEYEIGSIIFAMPTASPRDRKDILSICKETGAKVRVLPGVYQLANGDVSVNRLKDVELTDLLGRDPIEINNDEVFQMLKGKTILVTGGGGSIGSELCRQIAAHQPKQLIIFDIYAVRYVILTVSRVLCRSISRISFSMRRHISTSR